MTDETRWLDDDEQQLWRLVRAFSWGFTAALDRQLNHDSMLSIGEYSVLATLSEAPGDQLRPSEAAADLGWERSRLSHLLRRMESKGFIERVPSPSDRRSNDVHLTAAGRYLIETAAPAHVTFVRETVFDPLSQEEQRHRLSALTKIRAAVREHDPRKGHDSGEDLLCDDPTG